VLDDGGVQGLLVPRAQRVEDRAVPAGGPAQARTGRARPRAPWSRRRSPARRGFTAGALGAFKAALVLRGVIADPATNAPLLPLDDAETRAVAAVLDELGLR
jgi:hypothetical protein